MESAVSIIISAKDEFSNVIGKASKGLSGLGSIAKSAIGGITAFGGAAIAAGTAISALAVKGSEYADFQENFNRLAGVEAPAALEAMKAATLGAVSELDLFNTSNKLMQQGLEANTLPGLADFATKLGEATNTFGSTTDIMQQVGDSIASGRLKPLEKMLGGIDLTGKSVAEIMELINQKAQEMPAVMADAGSAAQKLKADFQNTIDQIGAGIGPVATQFLQGINQIIPAIQPLIPLLSSALGQTLTALQPTITEFATQFTDIATIFTTQLLPALLPLLPTLTELSKTILSAVGPIIEALMPAIVALIPIIQMLGDLLNWALKLILPPFTFAIELVSLGIEAVADAVVWLIDKFKGLWDWIVKIGEKLGLDAAWDFVMNIIEPKKMATGGVVTRPTSAIIGEAGPEAVIPLDKFDGFKGKNNASNLTEGDKNVTVNIGNVYGIDSQSISEALNTTLGNMVRTW